MILPSRHALVLGLAALLLALPAVADEAEPNDGFADANPAGCPSVQNGDISPLGDVDIYLVTGTPGSVVSLDIDTPSSTLDSLLGIFDSSLVRIGFNDDSLAPDETGFSVDSYVETVIPSDGQIYVAVTSFRDILFNGTNATKTGAYILDIGCDAPSGEPNDTPTTASAIGCGFPLDGSIDSSDVDYYVLHGPPGLNLAIDVDADETGSSLNPILGVFENTSEAVDNVHCTANNVPFACCTGPGTGTCAPSLVQIAVSDDDAAPGEPGSLDPYLELTMPQEGLDGLGQVYIAVSSSADTDFNGDGATMGPYHLSIVCTPADDEPNNSFATATFTECGAVKSAFISPLTDVDFYRMVGVPGETVAVDIDAIDDGSTLDSNLGIFDSAFTLLGLSEDDGAQGEGSTFDSYLKDIVVPADGILYIAVSSFSDSDFNGGGSDTTGFYTMFVECSAAPCTAALSLSEGEGTCSSSNPLTLSLQNPDCPIKDIVTTIHDVPEWLTADGCTIDPSLSGAGFSCSFSDDGTSVEVTIDAVGAGTIPISGTAQPIAEITFTGNGSCLDDCVTDLGMQLEPTSVLDDTDSPVSVPVTDGALSLCTCGVRGDASCNDDPCDMSDIVMSIDQALGKEADTCEADVDCSCGVNVFDVLCQIDCSLGTASHCLVHPCAYTGCVGSTCMAPLLAPATATAAQPGVPLGVQLTPARPAARGEATASLALRSVSTPVRGLAVTVQVPAPWRVTAVESGPLGSGQPAFHQDGETLRVVLVRLDGDPVATQSGTLIELSLGSEGADVGPRAPMLELIAAEAVDASGEPLDLRLLRGRAPEGRTGRDRN